MTGFGSSSCTCGSSRYTVEIKSVNHRFFDLRIRSPQLFNSLEIKIRDILKSLLVRGSIDCYIKLQKSSQNQERTGLNVESLEQHLDLLSKAKKRFKLDGKITISDLLNIPDLFKPEEALALDKETERKILSCMESASRLVLKMQKQEGNKTKSSISKHIDLIVANIKKIRTETKKTVEDISKDLHDKISTLLEGKAISEDRLVTEAGIIANRSDITEELDRLDSHIVQFKQTLKNSKNEVGKKLDFIAQEINREINTISSKATGSKVSIVCIECKSLAEKIREQIQNVK